ncbi:MAG TPA: hypothetical protein VF981_16565 [Gemmatimonadaceae bacterium]
MGTPSTLRAVRPWLATREKRSRQWTLVYDYVLCAVPGCLVRTRVPTEFGTCPMAIWDDHHFDWAKERKA